MERTTQTLHFRYTPLLKVGSTIKDRTFITAGLPAKLEGSWQVASVTRNEDQAFGTERAFTAILEPLP